MDDITTLLAGDFAGLSGLTSLNLTNNNLEELPSGIFSGLTSLTTLTLDNNDLRTLSSGLFSGLTSLTTLTLPNNNLTDSNVPGDIFSGLTNLRTLNLDGNDFMTLPAGIFSGLALTGALAISNPNSGDLLTLTATLKFTTTPGMALVEIPQGVPFTSVTATVTITGGTFDDPQPETDVTINSDTEIVVTIANGDTESSEFAYTVDPNEISTVITVSTLTPDPEEIVEGFTAVLFTGYNGFALAAGDPLILGDGICNRTPAVQTAILARIDSLTADDCGMVTNALLGMIGGALSLSDTTVDDDTDDITTLLAGDLDGLTSLISVDLSSNLLTGLPAGLFSDLGSLTTLFLQGQRLNIPPRRNI